ncbi:MAG: hemolysin family protein [Oscillospiraceae bacterium]
MESYWPTIIILLILLCLSAFFSASETAMTAANKIRLKNQAEDGDKKAAKAMGLINAYDRSLSTLLVGNNIVNILTASLTTVIFTNLLGDSGVGVATGVATVAVIIFGEVLPKSYANDNSENVIKFASGVLTPMSVILSPVTKLLTLMKNALKRKGDTGEGLPSVTEQELMSIIDEIEDEGVLEQDEAQLVQSAIEFNDISADEILTHRVEICAIGITDGIEVIRDEFLKDNFSRMPVFENSIDHIVGVINQKDFFATLIKGEEFDITQLIKPCIYVPPKKKIIDIMHVLQKNKVHMAVVTDEYGGTIGILTLEDILEELVGDIWDEHDEVTQFVQVLEDGVFAVLGEISMDDLYETVLDTKSNNIKGYMTLSGYLLDKLNCIPEEGDTYDDAFIHYTVVEVVDNRIKLVKARVLKPEDFEV